MKKNKNKYNEKEEYTEIVMFSKGGALTGKVKIDNCNFKELKKYNWILDSVGYASSIIDKIPVRMHRIILLAQRGFITDHTNRDKLDNRIKNLRLVTRQENNFNKIGKKNGVRLTSAKKWNARIGWKGKERHIGNFETKLEAKTAYLKEKNKFLKKVFHSKRT